MAIHDKTTNNSYERSLTQLSHNQQKYISLTLLRTLEKLCKKRNHGMVDLQPILTKTPKQDSSSVKHRQVVYKKKHVYKERKETSHAKKKNIHHLIYIYIKEYNVCKKWLQDHGTCNEKRIKTSLHPLEVNSKTKNSPPI